MGKVDLPDHPRRAVVFAVEQAAWRRGGSDIQGRSASSSSIRSNSAPVQRALWEDLDQWSTRACRSAALAGSQAQGWNPRATVATGESGIPEDPRGYIHGFEDHSLSVQPTDRISIKTFIPTINPPVITPPYEDNPANGPIYPSYVPKTDSDGNDIAGIRLPELTVPLATYTGWGLRSGVWANDGCESFGTIHPVQSDGGRTHGSGRSASIGPGALSLVRNVSQRGGTRDRSSGAEPVHALRGCR